MKVLLHPVFIASVLLAAINQLLERNGIFLPFIHSYLDDLLCFPIVLTVGLAGYRLLYSDNSYTLGPWQVWPVVVLYAVMFEWVLPSTSPVYTQDALDVVAYVVGTVVFMRWVNREGQAPISLRQASKMASASSRVSASA
jgi:hypothetical protein